MIDSIAMVLCILGFGALALKFDKAGFALSGAGSVAWLLFALGVNSTPLLLQSLAFLLFSGVGLGKCFQRS
jgi:hypothetical protein